MKQRKTHHAGDNLRIIRCIRGIKQSDIAGRLGVTQSAYSAIEKGTAHLSVSQLDTLSDILRVPKGCLLSSDEFTVMCGKDRVIGNDTLELLTRNHERHVSDLKDTIAFLKGIISDMMGRGADVVNEDVV